MSNGVNGVSCLLYVGADYATKTDIVGQGDATVTHNGDGIVISNKSTGGKRVYLDSSDGNNSTEQSIDIALQLTFMNDAAQKAEIDDIFNKVQKSYIFDFIDYYYIGTFLPKLNTETATKDTAVTLDVTYFSSGDFQRVEVTP